MKRKTRLRLLLAIIFFLPLAADAARGGEAPGAAIPQQIISLGPALTEELILLGAGDKIVGVTTYCVLPADLQKIERVGTVTNFDLERVVALRPDVVLASSLTNRAQVEKLADLGIRVEPFPYYKNYQQICAEFVRLGAIVGRKKEAEKIVRLAGERVEKVAGQTSNLSQPKVFLQVGTKPLFTVSDQSFVNDFIKLAGGENIAAGSGTGMYSREEVLRQNPDVIIITAMGLAGEKEKQKWQQIRELSAVKKGQIYVIDPYKIGSPTPQTFAAILAEIAVMIHPQIELED